MPITRILWMNLTMWVVYLSVNDVCATDNIKKWGNVDS